MLGRVVVGTTVVPPRGALVGGKKVNVGSSVVTVTGSVTLGTGIVAVPSIIMTDTLETMGSPLGPVHVVAGREVVIGFVVGGISPGVKGPAGSTPGLVGGGRPMVEPLHVVSDSVVVK